MARRKKKEEHMNHERWLVSYADFITLLFAFFTSLYAISTVDAKKAGQLVFSTRSAFNMDFFPTTKATLGSSHPEPALELPTQVSMVREQFVPIKNKKATVFNPEGSMSIAEFRSVYNDVSQAVSTKQLYGVSVSHNKYGIVVSLKDATFFEPGKAELRREALPTLDAVIERLLGKHLDIRVEGHTDGTMFTGTRYRSNWELSTARASSVVSYLIEQFAYPSESLSIAGFASNKPVGDNTTEIGRASNRRVDIVLLMPHIDEMPNPTELHDMEKAEQQPDQAAAPAVP